MTMREKKTIECRSSPWPSRTHSGSKIKTMRDGGLWLTVAKCVFCGEYESLGPANDTSEALIELRAAELAAIATEPAKICGKLVPWQMPIGFTLLEDRGWYDRERARWDQPVASVWQIAEQGWLAYAIVHHDEEQRS